eukprot:7340558-Prymnesium_polylepis.1
MVTGLLLLRALAVARCATLEASSSILACATLVTTPPYRTEPPEAPAARAAARISATAASSCVCHAPACRA